MKTQQIAGHYAIPMIEPFSDLPAPFGVGHPPAVAPAQGSAPEPEVQEPEPPARRRHAARYYGSLAGAVCVCLAAAWVIEMHWVHPPSAAPVRAPTAVRQPPSAASPPAAAETIHSGTAPRLDTREVSRGARHVESVPHRTPLSSMSRSANPAHRLNANHVNARRVTSGDLAAPQQGPSLPAAAAPRAQPDTGRTPWLRTQQRLTDG